MNIVDLTTIPLAKRPDMEAWHIVCEQVSQGHAKVFQEGKSYFLTFSDEIEAIPFEHLVYNNKRGLYDKRLYPQDE
jgi:hypothetical protein